MMEKAIKQRLLGGLVLVAGAALFLPVLFDGSGASLTIPPLPEAPQVAGVEAMAPALDQKVAEADKAVDAAHAGREPAPAPAAAVPADAAEGEGGAVVPDAAAVVAGTAAAGAGAVVSGQAPAAPISSKPASQVVLPAAKPVVPPADSSKPAVTATAPTKPAAAKPVDSKAASLPDAWIVQVASLSTRDKAQALVKQLRGKGYAAVLRPQGGQYKVMVGPELNRSVADSIKSRLAADPELRLSGWVQPYKP